MSAATIQASGADGGRWLLPAVGALGVSCVATQLVLMREMLCVFAGNELVLGIVLGNWLLLMGAGAWLGRWAGRLKDPIGCFLWIQILVALLPVMEVFAVRALRNEVFTRGAAAGLNATVVSSFLVLLPYCLAAGFLLTCACAIRSQGGGDRGAGRVYVADSVGSILGGAVFSLLLVRVVNSFALLAAVGLLTLALAGLIAWEWRRKRTLAAIMAVGAWIVFMELAFQPDLTTTKRQYASEEILFRGNSPYGQLVVTAANRQLNFIHNGLPVLSTHNTERVEEAVHYAMAQRPDARQVLLVGGGVAGTAKELLKYRGEVTYVELDPLFLELGWRFMPQNLADARIAIVNTDGRRFVQRANDRFDVIIVDLADPVTAQLNRFHTAEFFAEAKRALATNGVLALAVGRYENYVSPELARVLATAHRTLRNAFTHVVMLPGGRVFFLASDGALSADIAERLDRARIKTRFVNRHSLEAMFTPDRRAALERALTEGAPLNRDFNPVLYFHCLRHWASQFDSRFGVVKVALGLVLMAYVVRLRGAAAAVFAGGFAASSLEVALLLGFQALCGSVYYQLGILVTVFMAGLAVGAAWANCGQGFGVRRQSVSGDGALTGSELTSNAACPDRSAASQSGVELRLPPHSKGSGSHRLLVFLALAIAAFAALLPLALKLLSVTPRLGGSAVVVQVVIGLLTFALAALAGAEFPVANEVESGAAGVAASRLYTADFLGASVGALLASAWLIPVLGVTMMCWMAAGLNLLGAAAVGLAAVAAPRQRAAV